MATAGFYVYEHRRLDTGAVFYVGKGSGGQEFQVRTQLCVHVEVSRGSEAAKKD